MKKSLITIFLSLIVLIVGAIHACAQETSGGNQTLTDAHPAQNLSGTDYSLKKGDVELGVWGGFSPGSTTWIGKTSNRRLALLAFRAGRVMGSKKNFSFEYTIDAAYARLVQPSETVVFQGSTPSTFIITSSGADANGFGLSPIGLKFIFRRHERVKPFVQTTGGFLIFDRAVPYDAAREFNFTFDVGGGVQIFSESRHAVMIGYKFHHFSNGGTRTVNPGVDSHVIYAGFSIFR